MYIHSVNVRLTLIQQPAEIYIPFTKTLWPIGSKTHLVGKNWWIEYLSRGKTKRLVDKNLGKLISNRQIC